MQLQLPEKLISSLQNIKGFNEKAFVDVHNSSEQIVSIRLNPSKPVEIDKQFSLADKIPWASNAYYLSKRPLFTLDPSFHCGAYYVQEASSMFLEHALKQTIDLTKSLRVLDLCAAPGGKSTLLQSLISKESLLVSNEVIKARSKILSENITKWGAENVIVTNNDPKDFSGLENYFDAIVVDAPCSGSGLFRKDPEAIKEWSEENVMLCNQRQQRILADVMPALKQDGVLIYSTCSYSKEEDEDILDWIAERFSVQSLQLSPEESWGIIESISTKSNSHGYRFYPDKLKGEGFFIAAFQKKEGNVFSIPKIKRMQVDRSTKNEEAILKEWIKENCSIAFFKNEDLLYAIPEKLISDLQFLRSNLYIRKAGILIGKIATKELIPEHEFALSNLIADNRPSIELSIEYALKYLKKEEIKTEPLRKGWYVVKYQKQNLGWIKALGNRINNYYPSDWRIRMRIE